MLLTIIFFVFGALSIFALAGGREEYSKPISDAWDQADRNFTRFIRSLKEEKARDVANRLAHMFGFIAAISFGSSFLLMAVGRPNTASFFLFVYSAITWQGVNWYTRSGAKLFFKEALPFPLMMAALPVMDAISGSDLTRTLANPLDPMLGPFIGFAPSTMENVWLLAALQIGIIMFFVIFMFVAMSVLFFPVMLSAVGVGLSSIWLARALHSVSSERPMRPFMVLLGVLSLAYFSFK